MSWQSRGGEASLPVDSSKIADLKRVARLLHYCSLPLLIYRCKTTHPPHGDVWFDGVQGYMISLYINYLNNLGFQLIKERSSSKQRTTTSVSSKTCSSSSSSSKCLQRSWPGGIIIVELIFQDNNFLVKLYTLERSRLQQPLLSPEVNVSFSKECSRYKDFIHVHSFMHDFHLRILLDLLNGTRVVPDSFQIRTFIEQCHMYSLPPPSFIRNLLKRGESKHTCSKLFNC